MKRVARAWVLVASVLFATTRALAAHSASGESFDSALAPDRAAPTLAVAIDTRFGVTRGAYPAAAFPQVSGYALLLLARADLQLGPSWVLVARVPLVLARVEQPAGALGGTTVAGGIGVATSF